MLLGRAAVADGANADRPRGLPASIIAAQDALAAVSAAASLLGSIPAGPQKTLRETVPGSSCLTDDRAGGPSVMRRLLHAAEAANDGGPVDPIPDVVVAANGQSRAARLVPVEDVEPRVAVARPDVQGR